MLSRCRSARVGVVELEEGESGASDGTMESVCDDLACMHVCVCVHLFNIRD